MKPAAPHSEGRRPRVLISAYACGPVEESEAGAGWAIVVGAASHHDVWLVTRSRFRPFINDALRDNPDLAKRLNVTYLELSPNLLRWKRGTPGVYWYYILWQRRLGVLARQLHKEVVFDVVHHATFAVDWLPCGLTRLAKVPLVWGPVGGATYLPWSLARWVGIRGLLGEVTRSSTTRLCRRVWGDAAARRASLVIAQNRDVAERFRFADVVVEPNASIPNLMPARPGELGGPRRAVFVGRLIPWKGGRLALAVLAHPIASGWQLVIYGSGREEQALRTMAARLRLDDRVTFAGQRPRAEVLAALSEADAMLFPSLHDSAGWAVAEASAAGLPVICLKIGGPPLLAGPNARAVPVGGNPVDALATELAHCLDQPTKPYLRWLPERFAGTTLDWYTRAASHPSAGRR